MNQEPSLKKVGHGGGKSYLVPYRLGRFKIVGAKNLLSGEEPKKWNVFAASYEDSTEFGSFATLEEAVEFARSLWRAEMKL